MGGQRPVTFEARTELPSDVIWISDADNSANAQNFKPNNYLRSTPKHIGDDLGVDVRDPVEGLPVVAECISRVRDLAAHAYPWTDLSTEWSDRSLGASIAKLSREHLDLVEPMPSILKQAYQGYSMVPDVVRPSFSDVGGGSIFSLRINRLRYANYLCQQMYPTGSWSVMATKAVMASRMDEFLNPSKPMVVEASVEFLNRDVRIPSSLIAFGSGGGSRNPLRHWITQPELAWLLHYANVHITGAVECYAGGPLPAKMQLPRLLTGDPVYALSVATGVLAENHWVGISSEHYVRKARPGATAKFESEVSPIAAWMRAYDRAYCFQLAAAVQAKGYMVTSYGYGSVNFWAPKDSYDQIMEVAEEVGACHPNLGAMKSRSMISVFE